MIPKIIHQTAPERHLWKPEWKQCQDTVHKIFPDFRYKLWSDKDLDQLVKDFFPWFYPVFISYPEQIYRVDAARYMMLYLYGGIYIDMDYEILENFYPYLDPSIPSVVESPFSNNEKVQNSLMASPPKHPFWLDVLREMASSSTVFFHSVLDATGPRMLDRVILSSSKPIRLLPMYQFNPPPIGNIYNANQWASLPNQKIFARHKCSASWRV